MTPEGANQKDQRGSIPFWSKRPPCSRPGKPMFHRRFEESLLRGQCRENGGLMKTRPGACKLLTRFGG